MRVIEFLILITVFLLPIQKFELPGNTALVDLISIPMIIITWGILLKKNKVVRFPLAFPQWLILVGSQIASFDSAFPGTNFLVLMQDIYLFIWFIILINIIEEERLLRIIVETWVVSAVVISIIIIILRMFGHGGREMGTFRNPNMAASYLLTSFFICLSIPFPRKRLLQFSIGLLFLFALLATGSNGAILGLVGGIGASLFQQLVSAKRLFLPFALLALVWMAVFVSLYVPLTNLPERAMSLASSFADRNDLLGMTVGRSQRGLESRGSIWEKGYKLFLEKPLGVGPGNSYLLLKAKGGMEMHNDFVAYLVDRGPIGLAGLLLMLIEIFICLKQSSTLENSSDYTGLPLTPFLTGAFVASILFSSAHEIFHFRHIWLLFAVIFILNKLLKSEVNGRTVGAKLLAE